MAVSWVMTQRNQQSSRGACARLRQAQPRGATGAARRRKAAFSPPTRPRVMRCAPPPSTATAVSGMDAPAASSTAFPVASRIGSSCRLHGTWRRQPRVSLRPCAVTALRSERKPCRSGLQESHTGTGMRDDLSRMENNSACSGNMHAVSMQAAGQQGPWLTYAWALGSGHL